MDNKDGALLMAEYLTPENFQRRHENLSRQAVHLLPQAERDDRVAATHWEYISRTTPRAPRGLFRPDGTVDPYAVDAYVYGILRHLAWRRHRDRAREPERVPLDERQIVVKEPPPPDDPEEEAKRLHIIRMQVLAAVALLPPAHLWALRKRFVEGKTVKEMAAEKECGEIAIRGYISRSLKVILGYLGVDDSLDMKKILAELLRELLKDPDDPPKSDSGEA